MAEGRRLPNFIQAFSRFAEVYNTSPRFVEAGARWMLGTAPTHGIAMRARGNMLKPNLFFMLVAGPGTGKSQLCKAVREIMLPATGFSLIPASITRAGLEDYMNGNLQGDRRNPDGTRILSNECIGLADEIQGILPENDLGHLTLYNQLYDLPGKHSAQTRSHGKLDLESPYISLMAGAQPAFLAITMPEQAWGMGFMSRTIMIFDVAGERRSMFEFRDVDHKLKADLIHDLKQVHKLSGWMEWTKDAQALYEEWWVAAGGLPIPSAKRLAMGYNARRDLHFAKLAMVESLADSNDLIVTADHVQRAIEFLLITEDRMKHIFNEMAHTGSMTALEDVIDQVRAATAAGNSFAEAKLIEILLQRFPATQVHAIIENLVQAQAIKNVGSIAAKGFRKFQAGPKVAVA